jgi:hypothetical protein
MSRRKESGHLAPPSPSAFGDLTGTSVPLRYLGQQGAVSAGGSRQFLEADLRTPLPRTLTFTDPEKISGLARRGEAWGDSESRQMLESRD